MLEDITRIDFKILSVFIPDFARTASIRQIIFELGINYPNAFNRIKLLIKTQILTKKKERHSSRISFNINNSFAVKLLGFVEECLSEKFLNLKQIVQTISAQDPLACIGLFGSRASGKARKESDWDIFIISTKKKEIEKLCKTRFPLHTNIQFQVFSAEEFTNSLNSTEETVVRHIIRNKQILYNPRPFYSIIREWGKLTYAPSPTN